MEYHNSQKSYFYNDQQNIQPLIKFSNVSSLKVYFDKYFDFQHLYFQM